MASRFLQDNNLGIFSEPGNVLNLMISDSTLPFDSEFSGLSRESDLQKRPITNNFDKNLGFIHNFLTFLSI